MSGKPISDSSSCDMFEMCNTIREKAIQNYMGSRDTGKG